MFPKKMGQAAVVIINRKKWAEPVVFNLCAAFKPTDNML